VKVAREGERRYRSAIGVGLGGARSFASGALSTGREIQGEMQSARARRATTEHTLNSALYQAHIYGSEGGDAQARVMQFAASRGMDPQAVAEGIAAAQGRFSVLAGSSATERRANLEQQLSLAEFAQSTYQSPTEVMLAAGALGEQGVTGSSQMEMLRAMTGTAQAGSVELSTVISTGLGPMMQNIARSVNSNMTAEQRSAAVRHAVAQSMAESEIGAAAGLTPRDSLNALAKMRQSLTSDRMASNLRTRLGHAQENVLFLFRETLDGFHEVGDQIRPALVLVDHFGPGRLDLFVQGLETVVPTARQGRETDDGEKTR
jgi:hypothetical protein